MTSTRLIAPFKPESWQTAAFRDKSPILLLTGTAGGGKSRVAGEKIHGYMLKYGGAMGLMARKNRESMENSVVLFMKNEVIGNDPRVRHYPSYHRFEYANGSILAYGGMRDNDQREQLRSIGKSGGLDFVWLEEATRFYEEDFDELLFRMRGKAGPWRQIVLTTNPDHPYHWINKRLILQQEATVLYSSFEDNPHNAADYLTFINKARGVRAKRLKGGKWAPSEGIVFDQFNYDVHVTSKAEYDPNLGGVRWFCDDGYAEGKGIGTESYHPRVILLAQETPVGGVNIFKEYYRTQVARYDDTIDEVLGYGYPEPEVCYVDSSAQMFIAQLQIKGYMALASTHDVEEGIKNVQQMMTEFVEDEPLLRIHPRCTELPREFQGYQRDESGQLIKADDHGPSATRYGTWHKRWAG